MSDFFEYLRDALLFLLGFILKGIVIVIVSAWAAAPVVLIYYLLTK